MLKVPEQVTPLLLTLAFLAGRAQAELVTYTDPTAWQAATSTSTMINFSGLVPDNSFALVPVPPGLTLDGVTFTVDRLVSDAQLFEVGNDTAGYFIPLLSSQTEDVFKYPANFEILLPADVTAVAWDYTAAVPDKISFSTGDTLSVSSQPFFGVTSTQPIASFEITGPFASLVMNLDDLRFGTAASVPEPTSLVLFGTGLLLVGICRITCRRA
jgi:hypothetical protein